jgi:hypothetical protein
MPLEFMVNYKTLDFVVFFIIIAKHTKIFFCFCFSGYPGRYIQVECLQKGLCDPNSLNVLII